MFIGECESRPRHGRVRGEGDGHGLPCRGRHVRQVGAAAKGAQVVGPVRVGEGDLVTRVNL